MVVREGFQRQPKAEPSDLQSDPLATREPHRSLYKIVNSGTP